MLARRLNRPMAIGAVVVVIAGGAVGIISATSSSGSADTSPAPGGPQARMGSNARSGPATGGTAGTVSSVSPPSFTVSTSTGQEVTVDVTASTSYRKGTGTASASAVTTGEPVLVLGTTDETTITATQVILQPPGDGSESGSASPVVPFERGAQSPSKQDGQIPGSYSEGSGTIVDGTTAN